MSVVATVDSNGPLQSVLTFFSGSLFPLFTPWPCFALQSTLSSLSLTGTMETGNELFCLGLGMKNNCYFFDPSN